jgi:hypothetical protein
MEDKMASETDFNMTPVTSSQIAEVGFNPTTGQGRVRFLKNGSLYEYDACSQEEADAIINAASVGTAFGQIWKGVKPFRRLE